MNDATHTPPEGLDLILARLGQMGRNEPFNGWRRGAAIRSSAEMLLRRFEGQRCDSRAVADCARCNAVFLAKTALELVEARAALSKAGQADGGGE